MRPLRVDGRRQLRLTDAIAAHLCATPGTTLLVTCVPNSGRVVLVKLGTFAVDIVTSLAESGDDVGDVTQAVGDSACGWCLGERR